MKWLGRRWNCHCESDFHFFSDQEWTDFHVLTGYSYLFFYKVSFQVFHWVVYWSVMILYLLWIQVLCRLRFVKISSQTISLMSHHVKNFLMCSLVTYVYSLKKWSLKYSGHIVSYRFQGSRIVIGQVCTFLSARHDVCSHRPSTNSVAQYYCLYFYAVLLIPTTYLFYNPNPSRHLFPSGSHLFVPRICTPVSGVLGCCLFEVFVQVFCSFLIKPSLYYRIADYFYCLNELFVTHMCKNIFPLFVFPIHFLRVCFDLLRSLKNVWDLRSNNFPLKHCFYQHSACSDMLCFYYF